MKQVYTEGLTFEKVWALFQENAERMKETDRILKENSEQLKETDRIVKENAEQFKQQMQETDRIVKETNRQLGKLGNRFGEMVEYMVRPSLLKKFGDLGFIFTKANRTEIVDREHGIFTEVDAFLENGSRVIAVEVKTKPSIDDIKDHIERMGKLRKYADAHHDKRAYWGGIAGAVISESEKNFALESGFFVITASGDTFTIITPEEDYQLREW